MVAKRLGCVNTHRPHDHTGHSTETALLRVHQDIAEAVDNECMTALVLLDLSHAFDVIDHGDWRCFILDSALYVLPSTSMGHLTRLVTGTHKGEHITSVIYKYEKM